ncbi:hypothetical protein NQZ68_038436 [Dissostichus eleginoides]|nr:hypothetical protein NQZ68_038436 [Dissostichus eleginoides]
MDEAWGGDLGWLHTRRLTAMQPRSDPIRPASSETLHPPVCFSYPDPCSTLAADPAVLESICQEGPRKEQCITPCSSSMGELAKSDMQCRSGDSMSRHINNTRLDISKSS